MILMRNLLFIVAVALCLVGCKTSKNAQEIGRGSQDVWQTMLVKQLESQVDDNLIKVKYNNGSTLYFSILDNFGHIALTWDHNGRNAFDEGVSGYKGQIEIPSFVTSGDHDEFVFQVIQIDENAFFNCDKVTGIHIPYSIGVIRRNAFKNCNELKEIKVDENNMTYCDVDGVLYSKDLRMLIQYPAKKLGEEFEMPAEVSLVCTEAFAGCDNLTKVTVSNNVTVISDYAFMNCTKLQEFRLGRSVRVIGVEAFKNCPELSFIYAPGFFAPHNSPTVFDAATKEKCKVTVPRGQKMNYMRQLEWGEFKNIQEEW